MKKIFAVVLSTSFLLTPLAFVSQASAAEHRRPPAMEKRVVVQKYHWKRGYRASAAERRRFSDVGDYRRYRLSAPPRGYRWVRADNDFLLIGITSGVISNIISGR